MARSGAAAVTIQDLIDAESSNPSEANRLALTLAVQRAGIVATVNQEAGTVTIWSSVSGYGGPGYTTYTMFIASRVTAPITEDEMVRAEIRRALDEAVGGGGE